VVANSLWGLAVLTASLAGVLWLPGGLILGVFVSLPLAVVYRLAAALAREEEASLRDALRATRDRAGAVLVLGLMTVAVGLVLVVNVVVGLAGIGGPLGWAIATAALWGMVVLLMWLVTAWPVLLDPLAAHRSARDRLRVAALVVLAHPARTLILAAVTLLVLVASAVVIAPLLLFAVSASACLGSRVVLPLADRVEDGQRG
jgi:uncharacterized membrane protein YesL